MEGLREDTKKLSKMINSNDEKLVLEKEIIKIKNQYGEDRYIGKIKINGIEFIPDFCFTYFLIKNVDKTRVLKRVLKMREFLRLCLNNCNYKTTFKINYDYIFLAKKQINNELDFKKLEKINESIDMCDNKDTEHYKELIHRKNNLTACIEEYENLTINNKLLEFLKEFRIEIGDMNGIDFRKKGTAGKGLQQVVLYNEEGVKKFLSYTRLDNVNLSKKEYAKLDDTGKYLHKRNNDRIIFTNVENMYKKVFNLEIKFTEYFYCKVGQAVKINTLISEYSNKLYNIFKTYIEIDREFGRKYSKVTENSFKLNFREYVERVLLKNIQYSYMTTQYNNYKAFKGKLSEIDKFIEKKEELRLIELFELINLIGRGARLELKCVEKLIEQEVVNKQDKLNDNNLLNQYKEMKGSLDKVEYFKGTLRYKREMINEFNDIFLNSNDTLSVSDFEVGIFKQFRDMMDKISNQSVDYYSLKHDMELKPLFSKEFVGMKYLDFCILNYKTKKELQENLDDWNKIDKYFKELEIKDNKSVKYYFNEYIKHKDNAKEISKILEDKREECKKYLRITEKELKDKYFELDHIVDTLSEYVNNEIENKIFIGKDRREIDTRYFVEFDNDYDSLFDSVPVSKPKNKLLS